MALFSCSSMFSSCCSFPIMEGLIWFQNALCIHEQTLFVHFHERKVKEVNYINLLIVHLLTRLLRLAAGKFDLFVVVLNSDQIQISCCAAPEYLELFPELLSSPTGAVWILYLNERIIWVCRPLKRLFLSRGWTSGTTTCDCAHACCRRRDNNEAFDSYHHSIAFDAMVGEFLNLWHHQQPVRSCTVAVTRLCFSLMAVNSSSSEAVIRFYLSLRYIALIFSSTLKV